MTVFICQFCGSERKSKKSLTGHEVFCKKNPNHKIQNTEPARKKAASLKIKCKWCDNKIVKSSIKKHEKACIKNPIVIATKTKTCPVCKTDFIGVSITCSYSCSNTHFRHGRRGGLQYADDDTLIERKDYRQLCFRYHNKECVVCGEKNIVAVHHLNENHDDNRPENLIPLCPTHHEYCHSKYKNLVDKVIEEYVIKWKLKNKDMEKPS